MESHAVKSAKVRIESAAYTPAKRSDIEFDLWTGRCSLTTRRDRCFNSFSQYIIPKSHVIGQEVTLFRVVDIDTGEVLDEWEEYGALPHNPVVVFER